MPDPLPLPGTDLAVSPLCLGGTAWGSSVSEPESLALLDRYAALGGNFLDTARIYSDWVPGEKRRSERILADWLRTRGLRDRIVLATKGAHPFIDSPTIPRTSATEIRDDLEGSLRTLRTDLVDLYWLHRDDPARPVGHFIDLLNTFRREGKIRFFGASNWSVTRIHEANAYAARAGLQGFSANQPFWCLGVARSGPPPFTGYVKFDPDAFRLHLDTHLAVVPYTSQAGGFFSKLALPPAQRPADLVQSPFHTPPNLAAAAVAQQIARERNIAVGAVVLAYLWSRPFPVVPIIGPSTIAQLEASFAALPVRLQPSELQALETASQSGLPAN